MILSVRAKDINRRDFWHARNFLYKQFSICSRSYNMASCCDCFNIGRSFAPTCECLDTTNTFKFFTIFYISFGINTWVVSYYRMFQEQYRPRTSGIFKDLWSTDLNQIPGIKCSLTSRLVPLNKVFPNTPNSKQMRPILVCSPLQKLLEARFLPKLEKHLTDKLTPVKQGLYIKWGFK